MSELVLEAPGSQPVVSLASYGRQTIAEEDIQAVVEALRSPFLTQGPRVDRFEKELAGYVGAPYAVACCNGTAALHLMMAALGVGPGDEVITSPITFLASANCVAYCGGTPVFADVDPYTRNLSVEAVEAAITPRTVGILAVHFGGLPCDMAGLRRVADRRGLWLVEDACHALGGSYREGPVGDCTHSSAAAFSFHPVKAMTTGEGGAVVTDDAELAEKMRSLRSHGTTKAPGQLTRPLPGPWYYEMQALGYNYRISDLQCALGSAQLGRVGAWTARRDELARCYDEGFEGLDWVRTPPRFPDRRSGHHLYAVEVDFEGMGTSRTRVMYGLRVEEIGTQVHYIPIVNQPYYRQCYGTRPEAYPAAQAYYARALSLPLFPAMGAGEVSRVVEALRRCVEGGR